jgi:hypothetical protein
MNPPSRFPVLRVAAQSAWQIRHGLAELDAAPPNVARARIILWARAWLAHYEKVVSAERARLRERRAA